MVEGDVDDAVAILDVEDYGVAAHFAPVPDNAEAVLAARHHAGEVDGADFEISCHWDGILYNRRFQNTGNDDGLSGFEEDSLAIVVGFANGVGKFGRSQVLGLAQRLAGDRGYAISTLGLVEVAAGGREDGGRGLGLFGGRRFDGNELRAVGILDGYGSGHEQAASGQDESRQESGGVRRQKSGQGISPKKESVVILGRGNRGCQLRGAKADRADGTEAYGMGGDVGESSSKSAKVCSSGGSETVG
jgi:hypothetical protein